MAERPDTATVRSPVRTESNSLIRNTYTLLAMTLLFSAATAGFAMVTGAAPMPWWGVLAGFFGLLFAVHWLQNSAWGLAAVFALTGFMGYTLGPIISIYLGLPNGPEIVMMAMGGTGIIFLGLSAYALTTRKDFSFMTGFLMGGIIVAFLAGIAAIVFEMPLLSLAVSAMFVLLMCGLILWETSRIVNGGETNYILATVTLFVALYNLFTSLLHLLYAFTQE